MLLYCDQLIRFLKKNWSKTPVWIFWLKKNWHESQINACSHLNYATERERTGINGAHSQSASSIIEPRLLNWFSAAAAHWQFTPHRNKYFFPDRNFPLRESVANILWLISLHSVCISPRALGSIQLVAEGVQLCAPATEWSWISTVCSPFSDLFRGTHTITFDWIKSNLSFWICLSGVYFLLAAHSSRA